jgi:short-subunit dehydrogenase
MDNETKPLAGKKVIILGGSAGIGLATANWPLPKVQMWLLYRAASSALTMR